MAEMDFNLLRSLRALLEERSVTRAAERLGVTQPAVSAALARLRHHYNDDLLIRVGNTYRLTPLATRLLERSADAVELADRVLAIGDDFDPATADRTFTLLASDYTTTVIGRALSRLLAERALSVKVQLRQLSTGSLDFPDFLRSVDVIVLPHSVIGDVPHRDLIRDTWVCLVARDNALIGDALSVDHLRSLPWVTTYRGDTSFTTSFRELRMYGIEPDVRIVTESYTALPTLIAGTTRIALMQQRLAGLLPAMENVRVLPCPLPLAPLVLAIWWHPSHHSDPGHQWFRRLLLDAAAIAQRPASDRQE